MPVPPPGHSGAAVLDVSTPIHVWPIRIAAEAAVPVPPGHSGAAVLFGPTVCLNAVLPTPHTHRCLLPACENPCPLPTPRGGYWLSCTLLVIGDPMTDGRFSLCLCDLSACLSGPSVPVIVHDGRLALEGVVERAVSSSYLGALPAPRAATAASASRAG